MSRTPYTVRTNNIQTTLGDLDADFAGRVDSREYSSPVSYTHLTLPTKRIV